MTVIVTLSGVEGLSEIVIINLITIQLKTIYVYILKCSDESYYIGLTNNLDRRLIEHNEGYDCGCYTFTRRPVELVYYQLCYSPNEAIQLEKRLKGWSRAKKEAFISENWKKLRDLSECHNLTSHRNLSKENP